MKKPATFFALAIFSVFISWAIAPHAYCNSSDLIKKVQPSTVKILVYDRAGNPTIQGSGFLFWPSGHLITNYHVLGEAVMARVRTYDGREFDVKSIAAEDRSADLIEAIIDVPSGDTRHLMPAGAEPRPGEPVMVIGSPLGVEKVVSEGEVLAIQEIPKYGKCIVHSAHSFPGSSGSPLVNARGEVIGIETAAAPGRPDINVAIPLERFSGLSPRYRQLQAGPPQAAVARQGNDHPGDARSEVLKAESNDPAAQVKLAMRYEMGEGVAKNCFDALSLYRKAAQQGFVEAEYHVGRMYYDGRCMGQNLGEAANWLKKAAERGYPDAQALFGKLCFNGEGVPRDRVNACMWTFLAASQGNREAEKTFRFMSVELTQAELKTAQERAKRWQPVK